jgi:hypothetical protein
MTAPTRYALVPVDLTPAMHNGLLTKSVTRDAKQHVQFACDKGWTAAIAASPNAGCVTRKLREQIAEDIHFAIMGTRLDAIYPEARRPWFAAADKAIAKLGLQVADAPAGEAVDAQ